MNFIAISYCLPDLDGEVFSKESLASLEHDTPIPLYAAGFQYKIGMVDESRLVGNVLVSYGEIEEGHGSYLNFDELERVCGVAIGYIRNAESKEIEKIMSISLTTNPTCPHTGIMFLRDKNA